MIIVLVGYMGSGKSSVGKQLSERIKVEFKDLDQEIENREDTAIADLFSKKGEIYFRKKERAVLESLLDSDNDFVLATGGGTPCFYDTISLLTSNNKITTIYLKASITSLTNRLFLEKEKRPLLSHLKSKKKVKEFISKHLFERSYYYNKAAIKITVDQKSIKEIVTEIYNEIKGA